MDRWWYGPKPIEIDWSSSMLESHGPREEPMKKFWLVWNEAGTAPKCKHPSLSAAKAEAHRLAETQPGTRFVVLEAVGSAQALQVVWQDAKEEVPF